MSRLILRNLWLVFLLLIGFKGFSATKSEYNLNSYLFHHLGVKEGLPHISVFGINQDTNGFLWFGTKSGICKYDGYSFHSFRNIEIENESNRAVGIVRQIEPLGKGKVFFVSEYLGLLQVCEKTDAAQPVYFNNSTDLTEAITAICYDPSDNCLFFGTKEGVVGKYYPASGIVELIGNIDQPDNLVVCLEIDGFGHLWIGCQQGVYCLKEKNTVVSLEKYVQLNDSQKLGLHPTNMKCVGQTLWITSVSGIHRLHLLNGHGNGYVHYTQKDYNPDGSQNNVTRDITIDKDSAVWFATGDGLVVYKNEKFSSIKQQPGSPNSLNDRFFYSIFFDNSGNLWAGSYFGGINVCFKTINGYDVIRSVEGGLKGRVVKDFTQTGEELWIGTEDNGISILNLKNGNWRYLNASNGLVSNNIQSVYNDSKGRIWIAYFRHGITQIVNGKTTHFKHDPTNNTSLSSNVCSKIQEDAYGNIWISTFNKGINLYDEPHRAFKRSADLQEVAINIQGILGHDKTTLIVGRLDGLYQTTSLGDVINRLHISGSKPKGINTIARHNNQLWVGTENNGLYIGEMVDTTLHFFKHLFFPETINKIITDQSNRCWVSMNQSLYCFSPEGKILKGFYYHQGYETIYNRDAGLLLSNGQIAFGGINGFVIINPDILLQNSRQLPVLITNLLINYNNRNDLLHSPIAQPKPIKLKYNNNSIAIEFVSLKYSLQNGRYYYRLKGFNDNWIASSSNRSASFNNLKPGRYVFEVSNNDPKYFVNSEKPTRLSFHIAPPWWETIYAYITYFILLLLFLYTFRNYSLKRMRKLDALKMEKFERRKELELYEAKLRLFTNISHEIRTPLTLIIGPLEEYINHKPERQNSVTLSVIRKNAHRLLYLINQILDFRKYEEHASGINLVRLDIALLVATVVEMFSEAARIKGVSINLQNNGVHNWVMGDADKLREVFFNLLSNALKFSPSGSTIEVVVYHENKAGIGETEPHRQAHNKEYVWVSVADSGPGIPTDLRQKIFNPYFTIQHSQTGLSTGIGLAIVNEIIKMHDGIVAIESGINNGSLFKVGLVNHIQGVTMNENSMIEQPRAQYPEIDPASLINMENEPHIVEKNVPRSSRKPIVLVVDDHPEMGIFIKETLSSAYEILMAGNGDQAYKLIGEIAPDLIISDISMPIMSGIELCRKVKGHFSTSGIPFILLSVHDSVDYQKEGVSTGADLYLTKPFDAGLLREWVANLLQQRDALASNIRKQILLEPDLPAIDSSDNQFLNEVKIIMEERMGDTTFNIEKMAELLGVSRTVLYRKFDQLIGVSPKDFIRQSRLKRAAQLLKTGQMTVSEVTYAVGYNDLRYFRESFYKQFGINPSEYKE